MTDDAKIHTCFKYHPAIAYEGDDCPVCVLIECWGVLARYVKTLEREIEELRKREMKYLIELP
jgi:hypothetical protein